MPWAVTELLNGVAVVQSEVTVELRNGGEPLGLCSSSVG